MFDPALSSTLAHRTGRRWRLLDAKELSVRINRFLQVAWTDVRAHLRSSGHDYARPRLQDEMVLLVIRQYFSLILNFVRLRLLQAVVLAILVEGIGRYPL